MVNEVDIRTALAALLKQFTALPHREQESEKKTEDFIRPLFEALGWVWLSSEVRPQYLVRAAGRATRVDYSFKRNDELRPSFYLEAKRFSNGLENPEDVRQALEYGKNSGTRWVVLTNFTRWRVFNADYFDEPKHAEVFEFDISGCLVNPDYLRRLMLFARDNGRGALDDYAKEHKKWKESADIEDLLTEQLLKARKALGKAILDQNLPRFDTGQNIEKEIDSCVQTILDRIIFCRALESGGCDPDYKLGDVLERWKNGDKRVQFYRDFLCPFFVNMDGIYDSSIFDLNRVDRLSIKNEDFIPVLETFYEEPKTKLRYRFDVLTTDILGHAYENYLSYKATAKRKGIEEEVFKRKQSGIYYTPEFLVDFLVKSTVGVLLKNCKTPQEALKLRIIDPACGSGTFLVRAFEEFKDWYVQYSRTHDDAGMVDFLDRVLESCLHGIDIDPRAARLARLNLFLRATNIQPLPQLNIIEKHSLVWDDELVREDNGSETKIGFVFERDFPLVKEAGGFDVVVGNPPWEKWKPDSQEFFEQFDPGFSKLPTQQAKKRIEELMKTRLMVKKRWGDKLREYEMYSTIYRRTYKWQSADVNGRMVSGDLDLYKLFTERAYMLLKQGGLCGFVVPSGIYTDLGAKGLRTMLFDHAEVKALYSFENRKFVFQDIDQRYKFVLLVFKKLGKTESFPCAFFLHSAEDLDAAIKKPTIMDVKFVRKASPAAWSVLEIKTPKDYVIVKKLLKHQLLGEKVGGTWNVNMQSGFHMTNDSHLFQTGKLVGVPLLEGKNIHQFTHQWKEANVARYKVYEKDIEANVSPDKIYHKGYWMAYRLIASSTNERTFIASVVPPGYVCGHSIAIVRVDNLKVLCFLTGLINSFVLDYFIRQKVSTNVTMFNFFETPVPRLSSGKEFDAIVRKVAQLVCITNEFTELKKETGIEHGITSENDRALARAQLDVMVAKLFEITKEELEHILKQFPLVDEKLKEIVLREYC